MQNFFQNHRGKLSFKAIILGLVLVVVLTTSGLLLIGKNNNNETMKQWNNETMDIQIPLNYTQPLIIAAFNNLLQIQPVNASSAQRIVETRFIASQEHEVIKYIDAYQNTDVEQTKYINKLKEDVILKSPGHPDRFEYYIDLYGFSAKGGPASGWDFEKDSTGNINFYPRGQKGNQLYKLFTIPAPYLIDADKNKSSTADVEMYLEDNILTLIPSQNWLTSHKYPIILDPTIEINILNVHSHPQQGEEWIVEFTTQGKADLKIIPQDQATIDDDEFLGLYCNGQQVEPQILAGDVIYYPNWQCLPRQSGAEAGDGIGRVIYFTKKAGKHTLKFEFGDQTTYAYNSPDLVTYYYNSYSSSDWTNPGNMVDGNIDTDATTVTNGAEEVLDANTCPGTDLGTITKVEYRAYGLTNNADLGITVFGNAVFYGTTISPEGWSDYVDISSWFLGWGLTWSDIPALDSNISCGGCSLAGCSCQLSRVEIRVTYTTAPSNSATIISSVSDSPDPVTVGSNTTFSTTWADDDVDEMGKIKICKTDVLADQNCADGFWATSTSFVAEGMVDLTYTAQSGDVATSPNNYFAYVCDDEAACVASGTGTAGTFSVNTQSTVPDIKIRGGANIRGGSFR